MQGMNYLLSPLNKNEDKKKREKIHGDEWAGGGRQRGTPADQRPRPTHWIIGLPRS